jgi:hypothetical protein
MTDVLSVNRVRLRSVESLNLDATVNKIHRRKSNPQAIFFNECGGGQYGQISSLRDIIRPQTSELAFHRYGNNEIVIIKN